SEMCIRDSLCDVSCPQFCHRRDKIQGGLLDALIFETNSIRGVMVTLVDYLAQIETAAYVKFARIM
ncbi:hypothetical protein, partial [Xanthomonas fragariae]|uniref:hypothetical protein n=1 Tax=Xanthomonas fragariae TaxID=48664 RepID=UPI001ADD15CB